MTKSLCLLKVCITLLQHLRAPWPVKNESSAGRTMVATAKADALAVSPQPKLADPILLVPTPQKNMAGTLRKYLANVCLIWMAACNIDRFEGGGEGRSMTPCCTLEVQYTHYWYAGLSLKGHGAQYPRLTRRFREATPVGGQEHASTGDCPASTCVLGKRSLLT